MNNARLKGSGLGMSRGTRRFYEDDECIDEKCESKSCKYTKKQIMEAIKHWKGVLKEMNESSVIDGIHIDVKFNYNMTPDITVFWTLDSYEFGIKKSNNALDILRQWKAEIEKYFSERGFNVEIVSMEGPVHYDNEFNFGIKCLEGCDKDALKQVLADEGAELS